MASILASEAAIYARLDPHARQKNIPLDRFWYNERVVVPLETFEQMLTMVGFELRPDQRASLQKQEVDFITLENVLEGVPLWKQKQTTITDYLSRRASNPHKLPSPPSSEQAELKLDLSARTSNYPTASPHTKRELKSKLQLTNTIKNIKNQGDYEITIKVGEANDICTKLKNGVQYLIDTSSKNMEVRILKNSKTETQVPVSQQKFDREYQQLKAKLINQPEEAEGTLEEDLKKVIVEVMCLSTEMEKQIRLLQRKGISH